MGEQDRDDLGRQVRDAWIAWARSQPNPKPSWLVPYDALSEADKEADRQIGEALTAPLRARLESIEQQRDDLRVVLRKAGGYVDLCGIRAGRNVSDATIDLSRRIVAILRATREKAVGTETKE